MKTKMNKELRLAQLKALEVFGKKAKTFALCGGTALELYYLKHRFSADLDFFSPRFNNKEIAEIVTAFDKAFGKKFKLESEFILPDRAKVKFYTIKVKGSQRPLKIDFAEDVLFKNPEISRIRGVRVYSAKNIYLMKIMAMAGNRIQTDDIGRQTMHGRQAARDVFDVYVLSKKIMPLHLYLKEIPGNLQRGMIHWYRTFSRQETKLSLLDLDIYDKKFNAHEMIMYLENEIKEFMKEVVG
ncbi:MAG: nucleotidyl transferase AbiEii/AbiGii toxin family protein [Candidatus Omnitrophica bacterium]|nr:nucleotidyl transferase AbiEii/AbiGii toxin family protein [Candidatus Omnitrophota bacterium]